MKLYVRLLALVFMVMLLASCSQGKLDTSSASNFVDSIQDMWDDAGEQERRDFQNYFYIAMNGRSDLITMSVLQREDINQMGSFYNVLSQRKGPEGMQSLDGLTISDIIEQGRTLKITYIDGRLQQIQREIDSLKDPSEFYQYYEAQRDRVKIVLPEDVQAIEGETGTVGMVNISLQVENDSDLPLVDIQKAYYGSPWEAILVADGQEKVVSLNGSSFKNDEGLPVFENGGIPAHTSMTLHIVEDISDANFSYPSKEPILVSFPEGFVPCLEGWERSFEGEDSFKRILELEKQAALLRKELLETRA
ncbi:MAG: hypothetical protein LBE38_07675 [Deltaproteobacteria bacterium]|jgi:hypothetical protein|nr:hypothetical protein [Deltaproteobacteria bacterium]